MSLDRAVRLPLPTPSLAAPSAASDLGAGVRALRRDDIPEICELFQNTFRRGQRLARDELARCFEETYLTSPNDRMRPASRVAYAADGRIEGFIGIITLGARFRERELRGGALGNLMVEGRDRARAALRLMRATMALDLDFIFSDTANRTSLDLSRAFKFSLMPLHSLEWVKILRPCATGAYMLARTHAFAGGVLAPLARAADLLARHLPFASLPSAESEADEDRPLAAEAFVAQAPAFLDRFTLKPEWNRAELHWLVKQASNKKGNGALHIREVIDPDGTPIGLFLLYARAGAVAQVLQVLSRRARDEPAVLAAAIRRAEQLGAVSVRGQAHPAAVAGLVRMPGILYHHVSGTVVYSRQEEVRKAFLSEDAYLGGLFGERWTRLLSDRFA